MAKAKIPIEEKFEKQDFDLFEALAAIDRKDYKYYDSLSEEQKQKFNPYMLIVFASSVSGKTEMQQYHLLSTNEFANTNMFNDFIQNHPKLQWLMLCASGLGKGKQYHSYIPSIKDSVASLKDKASLKDIKEYYSKIYKNADSDIINELAELYTTLQNKKYEINKRFPELKLQDIDTLSQLITENDLLKYDAESGN